MERSATRAAAGAFPRGKSTETPKRRSTGRFSSSPQSPVWTPTPVKSASAAFGRGDRGQETSEASEGSECSDELVFFDATDRVFPDATAVVIMERQGDLEQALERAAAELRRSTEKAQGLQREVCAKDSQLEDMAQTWGQVVKATSARSKADLQHARRALMQARAAHEAQRKKWQLESRELHWQVTSLRGAPRHSSAKRI